MPADPEIGAYYERGTEQGRLASWGRLERLRTLELLERYLPPAPAIVLDVGGGAGGFARDVAEGQHCNPDDRPRWFTTAYFHRTAKREVLMRAIAHVEAEPSLLGASPHVMAIATRR